LSKTKEERGVAVKKMMKKIIVWLLVFMLSISINISAAQKIYYNDAYHDYDGGEIKLIVGGKALQNLPMQPVIIDGRTLVPVREVFEAMGSDVIWHDDTCQVEIAANGVSVLIKIGDRNTYVNGELVKISDDQPLPMLIGHEPDNLKSMVPVRFIAEQLGFTVAWNDTTRTVAISTKTDSSDELIEGTVESGKIKFNDPTAESDGVYDFVYIKTDKPVSPKVRRYPDPERIVFDFPGAEFKTLGGTIELDGMSVKSVRFSNFEGAARVVMDVSDKTQIAVMANEGGGIKLRALKHENIQVIYDAFSKRVYFDKGYSGEGEAIENGYRVTFSDLSMKNQKITINDGFIYEILITQEQNGGCSVVADGSNSLKYSKESGIVKKKDAQNGGEEIKKPSDADGRKIVIIDAGHGGTDPGAVGYDSNGKAVAYESHINLAIAKRTQAKLIQNGIEVIMTRSTDDFITLGDRAEIENLSNCDMFVSIHCNSIDNAKIAGTQVYYHPSSERGTLLAENIYDKLVDITGLAPKKTQNGSHLFVIRKTLSPAVLVETAFISNPEDRKYLLSESGQEDIANAIVQGIVKTFNEI